MVTLRNLTPDDSRALLDRAGIDPHLHERMVRLTYGHPLGLALLTDLVARGGQVESDVLPLDLVEVLLQRFVETVPDSRHRRVLGACAVARCTTEALLRDVLQEGDVHDVFCANKGTPDQWFYDGPEPPNSYPRPGQSRAAIARMRSAISLNGHAPCCVSGCHQQAPTH